MTEQQTPDERRHRVIFVSVGRDHRSWQETVTGMPDEAQIARMVRKSRALASRDIECVFDEDLTYGTIIVGGFRPVGAFRVEELPA